MGGVSVEGADLSPEERIVHLDRFMDWFSKAGIIGPIETESLEDEALRVENTNDKVLQRVITFMRENYAEQFQKITQDYRENFIFIDSKNVMGDFLQAFGYEEGSVPEFMAKPWNFLIVTALTWDSLDEPAREIIHGILKSILEDLMIQKMAAQIYINMQNSENSAEKASLPGPSAGFMNPVRGEA